ncbi:hypothetical protein ACLMAJ_26865 [Nocardia sp. KC 131]|uniref:hypothetical protein n=1 Tax=Nocardia arseniciresistens TaxID=3392119 RepID=UPI00398EE435
MHQRVSETFVDVMWAGTDIDIVDKPARTVRVAIVVVAGARCGGVPVQFVIDAPSSQAAR